MDLSNYEDVLKRHLSLHDLTLSPEQSTIIDYDSGLTIHVEVSETTEDIYLYSNFGKFHYAEKENVYHELLMANYFTHETLGATFSISPTNGNIVLSRTLVIRDTNLNRFLEIFDEFAKSASYWQKEFITFTQKSASQQTMGVTREGAVYA